MKKYFVLCTIILVGFISTACGNNQQDENTIVLLNGQFSEITILMQMAGLLIEEHTGLNVSFHDSMATVPAANALQAGSIDLYIGYDGTLLTTLLGYDPTDVPLGEYLFEWARQRGAEVRGITLLEKFGFENTFALAIQQDFAREHNIVTISDLVPFAPNLIFGAEHEFFDVEGTMRFGPFNAHYGFEWLSYSSMELALKYAAMDAGHIDVTMVYSTDGLNQVFNLFILEDDLAFFPEYYAAFQFRTTLFEEFEDSAPNLFEVLSMLNGMIDNETMISMNYAVDALGRNEREVAREFLLSVGLIS